MNMQKELTLELGSIRTDGSVIKVIAYDPNEQAQKGTITCSKCVFLSILSPAAPGCSQFSYVSNLLQV